MITSAVDALLKMALAEDLGSGDITSLTFIPEESLSQGRIITRKSAIAAGLSVAVEVFRQIDPRIQVTLLVCDGDLIPAGASLLELAGPTRSLLSGERVALNFLGKLMGVATLTQDYVTAVSGTGVTILDTRKMTPGWRELEKEAVVLGGGKNHRKGLFDAVLVKDNHLAALGEEQHALLPGVIRKLSEKHPKMKIELEADTLDQVAFFLTIPEINVILLDNMSCDMMQQAVALKNQLAPHVRLEASGGITLENIRAVAETGIDEISLGALTHSALWADLSLEVC